MKSGLFILLCLFSGNALLTAQEPEDYLLSGESYGYVLPEDIRIQGAGEIDSAARLVVWGTIGYNKGKDAVNILVAHINGRQFRLSGEEARPFDVVEVVPLDDRFLVLWNDKRREKPGIYGRIVAADGEVEGEEMLLDGGGKLREIVACWNVAGRRVLLWNDVRKNLESAYTLYLDDEGRPSGNAIRAAATGVIGEDIYPLMGDGIVLPLKDGEVVLVSADGTIDPRTVPGERFRRPHFFTGDSSLVMLRGHSLEFYRSLHDELPERTVDLSPILPDKEVLALSRDSVGWFLASYSVAETNHQAYLYLHQLYFDPLDLRDTVTVLKTITTVGPWAVILKLSDTLLSVRYTEANVVQIVVRGSITYDPNGPATTKTEIGEYTFYISGGEQRESSFIPYSRLPVIRTSSESYSGVTVGWNASTDTLHLLSGIVPYKHPVWYKLKSIGVSDDTVCVKWFNKANDVLCRCYSGLYSSPIDSCRDDLEWREQNSRDTTHILSPQGLRIVLRGSPEGLLVSLYGWLSRPLLTIEGEPLQNIRISRTTAGAGRPVGFLRNDTLFAVWEDHSLVGGSDIYGTWWELPKQVMTERGEILVLDTAQLPAIQTGGFAGFFRGAKIVNIAPNPAVGSARLTLDMRYHQGYVGISLFDPLGREVRRFTRFIEEGRRAFPLDISGLSSGAYEVRVTTKLSTDSRRLVVRQE